MLPDLREISEISRRSVIFIQFEKNSIYQNKTNLAEKIRLASPDLDTSLPLLQASFNDEFAGVRGTGPVDAAASPAAAVALHGRRAAGDERVALGVVEGQDPVRTSRAREERRQKTWANLSFGAASVSEGDAERSEHASHSC